MKAHKAGRFAVVLAGLAFVAPSAATDREVSSVSGRAASVSDVARTHHSATLLTDGRVLLAGGADGSGSPIASVEILDPSIGLVTQVASLENAREDHTATLLTNGKVLVAGGSDTTGAPLASTEIYDPSSNTWSLGPPLATARARHTATRLQNGTVLFVGGTGKSSVVASSELLKADASVISASGPLVAARTDHSATLLADGTVLVTGGQDGSGPLATVERFDPAKGVFSAAAALTDARADHVALRLADGTVLAAGGNGVSGPLSSAERYDPVNDQWAPAGALNAARFCAAGAVLPTGVAVVMGGRDAASEIDSVETYDPVAGIFTLVAPLATARADEVATVLASGRVLVSGGDASGAPIVAPEYLDFTAPAWTDTSATDSSRVGHTATLLSNGTVLIAGGQDGFGGYLASAQIFDPETGAFTETGHMLSARTGHTATLLPSGLVLVTGGVVGSGAVLATAEVFDPTSGSFQETGAMNVPRAGHTAILLPSGVVLVAGGESPNNGVAAVTFTAELYDPGTGAFSLAESMTQGRTNHTASLLPGGDVIVVGGEDVNGSPLASCERWSSATWSWYSAPALSSPRSRHSATILEDGRVLIAGGISSTGSVATVSIFDAAGGFTDVAPLGNARAQHAAVLLTTGDVLVAGGTANGSELFSTERFEVATGTWSPLPDTSRAREGLTLTVVPDGRVLASGGDAGELVHVAEILDLGLDALGSLSPSLDDGLPERAPGAPLALTGSGLAAGEEASGGGVRGSATNSPVLRLEGVSGSVSRLGVTSFSAAAVSSLVPKSLIPGWYWVRPMTAGASGLARAMLIIPSILVSPGSVTVPPLGAQAFSAAGSSGFVWSLDSNPSGGSIDKDSGAYVAGPTGGVTDVVRVTDSVGNTATASVSVGPALTIQGGGQGGTNPGTKVQFTATGGSGAGYVWTLGTSGSGSTIDPTTGLYTAGPNRNVADVIIVQDSLGNKAALNYYVWPAWQVGGSGCNCGTGGSGSTPVVLLLALLGLRKVGQRSPSRNRNFVVGSSVVLLTLLVAGPTWAQGTSIVVERFEPLGGARDVLGVGSASVIGHLERSAGFAYSYASRPLGLSAPDGLSYAILKTQSTAEVGLSVGLFDRVELAVVASGSDSQTDLRAVNVPITLQPNFAQEAFSDLRIVPKVRLAEFGWFAAAVAVPVTLPTGRPQAFVGEAAATYEPRLLGEASLGRLRMLGSVGYDVRPARQILDTTIGNAVTYGLAAEFPAHRTFAMLVSLVGERGTTPAASPLEAQAALRVNTGSLVGLTVGAGRGLSSGYGAPDWRGFAMVTFAPFAPASQQDFAETDAKPASSPSAPEAQPSEDSPERPVTARVVAGYVPLPPPPPTQFDQRVYFAVNESAIPPRYYSVLDSLAKELLDNPKPVHIVVEGHADENGLPKHNLMLSKERAEKVRLVLERAGVPAERIRSEGFGETRPAVPGKHSMNRRVEFRLE